MSECNNLVISKLDNEINVTKSNSNKEFITHIRIWLKPIIKDEILKYQNSNIKKLCNLWQYLYVRI